METPDYTAPTVNWNGTSREALIAQQVAIMDAAQRLIDALRDARPHGRDYQTAKSGDYEKAVTEWAEVHAATIRTHDYALAVGQKIAAQS